MTEPKLKPIDPSPTPWDYSTWGFYCDNCGIFFDLVTQGRVETVPGNLCGYSTYWHKTCNKEARYIGYSREAVASEASPREGWCPECEVVVDEAHMKRHGEPAPRDVCREKWMTDTLGDGLATQREKAAYDAGWRDRERASALDHSKT